MLGLWYLLVFWVGASVGSFLNVLIMRTIQGRDWVRGRSVCDHCGKELHWYEMVPLLSYACYRGRSRCCGRPLSIQHPVVETLVGLLFVWWLTIGSLFFRLVAEPLSTLQPLFWLLLGLILISILVSDLFYGLIPSPFVGAGVVLVLLYRLILAFSGVYQWSDYLFSLGAAAGAWAFFWFLRYVTKEKGMGDGDVILAFLMGLVLGWPKIMIGVLASFVTGSIISLGLVLSGSRKLRSTVPFGPFMIIGIAVALLWGKQLLTLITG